VPTPQDLRSNIGDLTNWCPHCNPVPRLPQEKHHFLFFAFHCLFFFNSLASLSSKTSIWNIGELFGESLYIVSGQITIPTDNLRGKKKKKSNQLSSRIHPQIISHTGQVTFSINDLEEQMQTTILICSS